MQELQLFLLFTSVQVDKAFDLVLELLSSDDALPSRTSLSISDIKQGLKICLDSTIFSYKDSFYKQTFGTPMGSCISPIIANIYMEHIEHIAITTFHIPPSLWLRYVDDTCCILEKEHVIAFHSHLKFLTLSVLVVSLPWKTKKTPLSPFLRFWYLVKLAMRVILLTYHSPLPVTKSLLTLTDICTVHHIIPNTRSSLWSKHYSIALTHTSPTTNLSTVSNYTYALHCNWTGFLPGPLFSRLGRHALRIPLTNISLLFLTFKAHQKKLEEF